MFRSLLASCTRCQPLTDHIARPSLERDGAAPSPCRCQSVLLFLFVCFCWCVRLNEGLEAMDMLKFGRVGEANEASEVSKMWTASFSPVRFLLPLPPLFQFYGVSDLALAPRGPLARTFSLLALPQAKTVLKYSKNKISVCRMFGGGIG